MIKLKRDRLSPSRWCSASREELQVAVQHLRNNFIAYDGPFVIKSGIAVFKVSDYLLTADEVVELYRSGKLNQKGLANFAREVNAIEEGMATPRNR
jgi:hypothetical protein